MVFLVNPENTMHDIYFRLLLIKKTLLYPQYDHIVSEANQTNSAII